jgi:hypothetical protein
LAAGVVATAGAPARSASVDPSAADERRGVLAGSGLRERDQAVRIAAHAAVGVVDCGCVQATLLGLLPEAAACGLGSRAAAGVHRRLLLVERDGDGCVLEVEQCGTNSSRAHVSTSAPFSS